MLEENVVSQAGAKNRNTSEREMIRQIVDAGFEPMQRDSLYNLIRKPDVEMILANKPEIDFASLPAVG
jgi:cyclic dehypoxanthinyl futalosine synthase